MTTPRGYKQTEVGVIPEDWRVAALGELALLERGKFSARPRNNPKYYGGAYPFLQTGDITHSGGRVFSFTQTLNEQGLSVSKLFPQGTLFFTIAANIGDVGISAFDAACPDSLIAISPFGEIKKEWLLYELASRKDEFEELATPGAQLNLNLERLRPFLLPVPAMTEQTAIAEVLSDTDNLLDSLQRLIDKKQGIKQATMQQLLSGQTRLPGFDGEWQVRRLGDFGSCLRGVGYNPQEDLSSTDTDESVRLLRANNIQQSKIILDGLQFVSSCRVLEQQLLKKDDILICMANGSKELVGKSARFFIEDGMQYTFGAFMGCYRPDNTLIVAKFVFYLFNSHEYRAQISTLLAGSAINNLAPSAIEDLMVNIPVQRQEQTAIAQVLSDMDEEIAALHKRLDKTRQLKQALMQELLSGRTRLVTPA